jgi:hypothetical protein
MAAGPGMAHGIVAVVYRQHAAERRRKSQMIDERARFRMMGPVETRADVLEAPRRVREALDILIRSAGFDQVDGGVGTIASTTRDRPA